jgi:hypothetical protein
MLSLGKGGLSWEIDEIGTYVVKVRGSTYRTYQFKKLTAACFSAV